MDSYLWIKCKQFVKYVCINRDESHGAKHMENVAINSITILSRMNIDLNEKFMNILVLSSWLHDVNDHKYSNNYLITQMFNFLKGLDFIDDNDIQLVLNIIDNISFSKECRLKKKNINVEETWLNLLGEKGLLIRNIVSDADKLEALGKQGIERCIKYSKEYYKNKYGKNPTHDEIIMMVKNHANEKLLILKDEYIRTKPGKQLAIPLHNELEKIIKLM